MCGVAEDHDHVFKKCFFLQDPLALIRSLWGLHVCDKIWYEPSRLCRDHSLVSVTTIQGWLVWTAVYARWLIRCEAINILRLDMATAVLQRFYVALLSWKSLPPGTLPQEVITTTCGCLKDILKLRDRLHGVATQKGNRFRLIPLTPPPPKKQGKKQPDRQGTSEGPEDRLKFRFPR